MTLPLDSIFIPSQISSNKLIIILHGRGDSAEGFRFFPQELGLNEFNYLLLNAPLESYPGFSWYDFPPHQLPGIQSSSKLLSHTLDILFSDRYTPEETFLFGFSQGSLLTFEFGSRYKKALAGYLAISGYIYDSKKILEDMNPQVNQNNWFCSHGFEDEVLAFEKSQMDVKLLQDAGFQIEFKTYHKGHTMIMQEIEDIKVWIQKRVP